MGLSFFIIDSGFHVSLILAVGANQVKSGVKAARPQLPDNFWREAKFG